MFYTISPEGYDNDVGLNELSSSKPVDKGLALVQHKALCRELGVIPHKPPNLHLPDFVYTANTGILLPRLPIKLVLLANMANERFRETPFVKKDLERMGFETVAFPGPEYWEGEGECCFFHDGHVMVLGYGYRATAATVPKMQRVLDTIYRRFGVAPPLVVGVRLASPSFYHLDIALCRISETQCLVQKGSLRNMKKLRQYLDVVEMESNDPLCLNLIVLKDRVVTHTLNAKDRKFLKKIYGNVVEMDVSEFEKGGGSVRCMVLRLK
jgi:N-dimethylarginine dimethylaminohydrolase